MQAHRIALCALAATTALAIPAAAQAAHPRHHHPPEARITFSARWHRPIVVAAVASNLVVGMGDVASFDCQNLPLAGATAVRIVIGYSDDPAADLECAQVAHADGYHVLLAVQYSNVWTIPQTQEWFRTVLSAYAPYAYSVSVGNEQELGQGGPGPTGGKYAQDWQAVEPIIAQMAPHAVRVAGELSPWGLATLKDAFAAGLPGVQAISDHPYPNVQRGDRPQAFVALASSEHVQAWATEGLCGPGAWMTYGCRSEGELHHDGYALAVEWYAAAGAAQAPMYGDVG